MVIKNGTGANLTGTRGFGIYQVAQHIDCICRSFLTALKTSMYVHLFGSECSKDHTLVVTDFRFFGRLFAGIV